MKNTAIHILAAMLVCLWAGLAVAQQNTADGKPPVADLDIEDWQARLELAELLVGAKRFDEAEQQYRKVLAEKPDNLQARQGLARILAWSGKPAEAKAVFSTLPS